MKLLLYCCKSKPYLYASDDNDIFYLETQLYRIRDNFNGKIVAECDFEVEEIYNSPDWYKEDLIYNTNTLSFNELLEKSCLDNQQLDNYLKGENGYAIHIKNLRIFDKPKELNEFYKFVGIDDKDIYNYKSIEKAPQNMMYAYEYISEIGFSGTWDRTLKDCIIISIRPEWLCKILNGEKTIEVRKKVLKELEQ